MLHEDQRRACGWPEPAEGEADPLRFDIFSGAVSRRCELLVDIKTSLEVGSGVTRQVARTLALTCLRFLNLALPNGDREPE